MTHVDEEVMQRRMHAELDPEARPIVEEHLALCVHCRDRAAAAVLDETRVLALLQLLDGPRSRIEPRQFIAQARTRNHAWLRWAAAFLVTVGLVGTAWATPGSPFRRWAAAMRARVSAERQVAPVPAPRTTLQTKETVASGLSMAPEASIVVVFTARQRSGVARVSLTSASEVSVQTLAANVPFRSELGRLVVENQGAAADFEVLIPRHAPRVEIRVGTARVYLKERDRVFADIPADSDSVRLISLAGAPR